MQTLRDIPVIWSLYLIILLVSAGSLLCASISFYTHYNFELKKTMVAEVASIATIAGLTSAEALLAKNRAAAAQNLAALGAHAHIAAACIYDNNGLPFASFSRGDSQRDALTVKAPNNTCYFDEQYLHLFHDITISNSRAGSIFILHDVTKLRSQKRKFLFIAALVFVSCMGLVALPSLFLQGIISAPILILASTMQKIARDKDYTFRMLQGSNREMGGLINDFNKMMHAILSHSQSLEKQAARDSSEIQITREALIDERHKLMKAEHQMEQILAKQQKAPAGAKMLCGIVPVCCSCKKIRDERGDWLQIEAYLNRHTHAEFSHGICPECSKALYPEFQPKLTQKTKGA